MKWNGPKSIAYSACKNWTGRISGIKLNVTWNGYYKYFYFVANSAGGLRYNSLWENKSFVSLEECQKAAEQYANNSAPIEKSKKNKPKQEE